MADLFVVLLKWKWVVVVSLVVALFVAATIVVSGEKVKRYDFRTALELGAVMTNTGIHPLDEPENLVAKLESTYIPNVKGMQYSSFSVKVDNPRKSNIVILNTYGSLDRQQDIEAFHKAIAEQVIADMRAVESELQGTLLVKKTTIILPTYSVPVPKGKSPLLILTLGLIVGGMAGIFLSLLFEFILNMRMELRSRLHVS